VKDAETLFFRHLKENKNKAAEALVSKAHLPFAAPGDNKHNAV
jgi:hypothetical protein